MDKSTIMNKNIQFHYSQKSMVDDFGRVFFYNNKVFREISNKNYCLELLNSDLFKELIGENLIPQTSITNEFSNNTDSLVLEHEKILESLQHEWSYQMLKDAAILVLKINTICNKYGYELKDAHTLNILFKGCKPVFVDIGSISLKKENTLWTAYSEFLNSFFFPLLFWSNNKHYIVRKLLESNFHRMFTIPFQSFEDSNLLSLINLNHHFYEFKVNKRIIFKTRKKHFFIDGFRKVFNFSLKKMLRINNYFASYSKEKDLTKVFPYKKIQKTILDLIPPKANSLWAGYHSKFYNDFEKIIISDRFNRLLDIINKYDDINSAIDLAGNEGYFSYLLSKKTKIDKIILADYDENAIDKAFINFKQNKITSITPLLLNFMFTPNMEDTAKRLKSDIALSLAVTHHLILTSGFSLSAILERLASYSKKYVMVEFMPLGLWSIENKKEQKLPDWYNVEWFRKEFSSKFELILEEQVEENRIVFFGKLK